jgi:hypothetical protein
MTGMVAGQIPIAATATSVSSSVAAGHLPGTATNDNAAAGQVGEFLSTVVQSGSSVAMPTGASVNAMSLGLTAGDWDVQAEVWLSLAGTATQLQAGINTTSATLPNGAVSTGTAFMTHAATGLGSFVIGLGPVRQSLASPGTVFLVASQTGGTGSVFGKLTARRVR